MKRKILLLSVLVVLLIFSSAIFAFAEDLSEPASEFVSEITSEPESEPEVIINSIFSFSEGEPLVVSINEEKVQLKPVEMFVDPSGDGKVTVVDARLILRYGTMVESYTGPVEDFDITEDGVINTVDARLVLRYCAVLDNYYRLEDGSVFKGFCKSADGKKFYVDDYGIVATGLETIDGAVYYIEKGFVVTGTRTILGSLYMFDNDGKGVTGVYTVNGVKIYFVDGKSFTGYADISGTDIFYADGVPVTGNFIVNGKELYFNSGKLHTGYKAGTDIYCVDGELATGKYTVNGKKLTFKDGKLLTGYLTESGKNVYYSKGELANGNFEINGVKYYFENGISTTGYKTVNGKSLYYQNGIVADGFTNIGSDTFYFTKGAMEYGWKKINNEYYCFDRSTGKMAKNTTVDGLKVGADGKAVKTTYSTEKIETFIKARNIMLSITNESDTTEEKKRKCFEWVMSCSYRQYRKVGASMSISGWEMLFANDIFNYRKGCCGSTSAAFAFLAVEAGAKNVYFCDDGVSTAGHAWVIMDGSNRVYDIIFAKSKGIKDNYNASVSDYRSKPPRKTYIGG